MARGARTRRQVFTGLKDLLGTVTGATYQERIDIKEGPAGRLDDYYDIGQYRDESDADWRAKTGTVHGRTAFATSTFAFRMQVKEPEETRLAARDKIDLVERALHRATDSGGSPLVFEGELRAVRESQSPSREWLFLECDIRLTWLFDLTVS